MGTSSINKKISDYFTLFGMFTALINATANLITSHTKNIKGAHFLFTNIITKSDIVGLSSVVY